MSNRAFFLVSPQFINFPKATGAHEELKISDLKSQSSHKFIWSEKVFFYLAELFVSSKVSPVESE